MAYVLVFKHTDPNHRALKTKPDVRVSWKLAWDRLRNRRFHGQGLIQTLMESVSLTLSTIPALPRVHVGE